MCTTLLETVRRQVKIKGDGNTLREATPSEHSVAINKNPYRMASIKEMISTCVTTIRDPIAEIQEKRGISKNQQFTFVDLLAALFNHSYNSCLCILTMIMGLMPLLEGLLNLLRFVLDKILEINECKNTNEKLIKGVIFLGQLFVLGLIVTLITMLILLPVFHLIEFCLMRIWSIGR